MRHFTRKHGLFLSTLTAVAICGVMIGCAVPTHGRRYLDVLDMGLSSRERAYIKQHGPPDYFAEISGDMERLGRWSDFPASLVWQVDERHFIYMEQNRLAIFRRGHLVSEGAPTEEHMRLIQMRNQDSS